MIYLQITRIKLTLLIFLSSIIMSCNHNPRIPRNVETYHIEKYTQSDYIEETFKKLVNINWRLQESINKREALYYLFEAIKIKEEKLCSLNPNSNIDIRGFEDIKKYLIEVDLTNQYSKPVFFYKFKDIENNDEISVEIRNKKNNNFTILCGVAID